MSYSGFDREQAARLSDKWGVWLNVVELDVLACVCEFDENNVPTYQRTIDSVAYECELTKGQVMQALWVLHAQGMLAPREEYAEKHRNTPETTFTLPPWDLADA